jgi:hypothetical protein
MTVHDDDRELPPQPELDALLDALRQPARPDELAGEQDAVAAMAAARASSREEGIAPVPITKHSRKLAAIGVAAALIVGGVTAAAASVLTGSPDNRVEIPAATSSSTSSSSTSTSTSSSTTSATVAGTTATSVDDHDDDQADDATSRSVDDRANSTDDTTVTTVECEDNHGQAVSQVAHDTPPGPDHGQIVSAAAHDHQCDDDATASSVPNGGSTPPTSDDHGGGDHSGPGRSGSDSGKSGSDISGSDHGNSGSGSSSSASSHD